MILLRRRLCCGLLRLFVTGILLHEIHPVVGVGASTTTGATTSSSSTSSSTQQQERDWLSECRHQGFDPWQLACKTCDLLPTQHHDTCRHCCQPYKDVERIRKPYEAAILVLHTTPSPGGELHQFLNEDWQDLAVAKGSRLSKMQHQQQMMDMQFAFFYQMSTATLLFFDQPRKNADSTDYDVMVNQAKEVIRLDGWKRDDIRDMLQALLP